MYVLLVHMYVIIVIVTVHSSDDSIVFSILAKFFVVSAFSC